MPDHLRGIDPELAAIVDAFPKGDPDDVPGTRARLQQWAEMGRERLGRPWAERVDVAAHEVAGPGGPIPVRVYTPKAADAPLGALVHFHGGAFALGNLDLSEHAAGTYADKAGIIVVDVDYRLAPEHPFPAGFDDCWAALCWTVERAADLGVERDRIVVGGQSAGGCLAAAVSLAARDRGGPAIAYQFLLYPCLDDRLTTHSVRTFTDTPMLDTASCEVMWPRYLAGTASDEVSPYAAPARADDLAGLPPAYLLACEFDPLRDEDVDYATRLIAAGVSVDLHVVGGAIHGFEAMPSALSRRAFREQIEVLRRAVGPRG